MTSAPRLVPPAPDPDLIVDPRIGARGRALLALEDGAVFAGVAFGADVAAGGDLVVNTSQTGYQEVCTDPSYAGQVVLMTYPLIGNYGRLRGDDQSERPWLRALVVATATAAVLEDARQLAALLRDAGIPAIAGVDTRALARHLRAHGCLRGILTAPGETDPVAAVAAARAVPRWEDQDFVGQVSPMAAVEVGDPAAEPDSPLVAIVDFGLKANIVRSLRRRGARHDLVAKADPEQRAAVGDHLARQRDRAGEPGRVAGTGREHDAVDLRREHRRGRHGAGQDANARAASSQAPHDVRLEAEIHDRDERGVGLRGRVADLDGCRERDLADEVLVLPAGHGAPLVAIVDFGLKANIVRSLRRRGARVRILSLIHI